MRLDGFKIAVNDAFLVGVLQGGTDLFADLDDVIPGKLAPAFEETDPAAPLPRTPSRSKAPLRIR